MPAAVVELVVRYVRTIWEANDHSTIIALMVDEDGVQRTVKGPLGMGPALQPGLSYRFHGHWERHEKYGQHLVFATYSAIPPHDRRGVIAYLKEVAEGVGDKRAARLWDAFGADAVTVLRRQPERVVEAGILSTEAAREASQALHDEAAFESVKIDLLALLDRRGFQMGPLIKECLRRWGARAPEVIRRNPYVLLLKKLPSCGFKRVDRLYLDLRLPPGRLKRQALCAWHAVQSDTSGHTWHEGQRVARALIEAIPDAQPKRALRLAIRGRLLAKRKDNKGVWLAEHKKAYHEAVVADKVKAMLRECVEERNDLLRQVLGYAPG